MRRAAVPLLDPEPPEEQLDNLLLHNLSLATSATLANSSDLVSDFDHEQDSSLTSLSDNNSIPKLIKDQLVLPDSLPTAPIVLYTDNILQVEQNAIVPCVPLNIQVSVFLPVVGHLSPTLYFGSHHSAYIKEVLDNIANKGLPKVEQDLLLSLNSSSSSSDLSD